MLKKAANLPIALKLALVQFIVAAVLFAGMSLFLSNKVSHTLETQAIGNLETLNGSVIDMIDAYREELEDKIDAFFPVFADHFPEDFVLDDTQQVEIRGQMTPALKNGNVLLNGRTAEVDHFLATTQVTSTVFVRKGDDFVRITTSVKKKNGERAVGTSLGVSHPGYRQLIQGNAYKGAAKLFNRDYMTLYEPIKDSGGRVIGILYIGFDFTESLHILKKKIRAIRVGETGYTFVLNAKSGSEAGTMLAHPVAENEGQNMLNTKDANGHEIFREMLEKKNGVIHYAWLNKKLGETEPRLKVSAYAYYPDWSWLVVSGSYLDEFNREATVVQGYILGGSAVTLLFIITLLYLGTRYWVAMPLQKAVQASKAISAGNLDNQIHTNSQDEVGQLLQSLNVMQTNLRHLMDAEKRAAQEREEAIAEQQRQEHEKRQLEEQRHREAQATAQQEREQAQALQRKVDSLLAVVSAASTGDLTQAVTVQGEDAIGQMGHGLEQFFGELRASLVGISLDAQSVACAADELTAVGQKIDHNAHTTAQQASTAAAGAEQVSANVNTVAAAAEQMTASIQEIAHHASTAARVAGEAVQLTASTDTTVRQLSDSSTDIGDIIRVITGIAEQTNLLALNATIEAARAGEAGKGFAVVANEVKELAKETAKATDEISHKIAAIQDGSSNAVEAIAQITATITQINDIQITIASAVEEQTATTNEISRSVSEAATGSVEIAQNIGRVAENAQTTLSATAVALTTASGLADTAGTLERRVGKFTLEVDASHGKETQKAITA